MEFELPFKKIQFSNSLKQSLTEICLNSLPTPVAVFDHDFNYVYVNNLYVVVLGLPAEEIIQKNIREISPTYRKNIIEKLFTISLPCSFHAVPLLNLYSQESQYLYYDWTLQSVENNEDNYIVLVMNDVTKQYLADKITERFWRQSPDIHCVMDVNGSVLRLNPAFARTTGYSDEEISFAWALELVHPEDKNKVLCAAEKLKQDQPVEFLEVRFLCSDGQYKWLSLNAMSNLYEGQVIIDGRDITSKKLMDRIFESNFHDSPIVKAIIRVKDKRYIAVNKSYEVKLGYSADEVIGRTGEDMGIFVDEQTLKARELAYQFNSVSSENLALRCKDGTIKEFIYSSSRVLYYGEECILFSAIDVTERRRMERELIRLEKLNIIGQMAGGIGHEIRNPMTVVRGYLQMIAKKERYQEDKEYFKLMIAELDRANEIITDFLTVSHRDTGELSQGNINKVIRYLAPLIEAHAFQQNKDIQVQLTMLPDCMMNENEIRQLILNLIRNALDASPEGKTVTIRTSVNNNLIVLTIEDHGCGIAPHILKDLGTPFLTTKEQGTGLGLAICYAIVDRHKGSINAATSSQGTIFTVMIPAVENL